MAILRPFPDSVMTFLSLITKTSNHKNACKMIGMQKITKFYQCLLFFNYFCEVHLHFWKWLFGLTFLRMAHYHVTPTFPNMFIYINGATLLKKMICLLMKSVEQRGKVTYAEMFDIPEEMFWPIGVKLSGVEALWI